MKYIILIVFFVIGASEAETVLSLHSASYHANREANYNESNYGLAIRHYTTKDRYLIAGTYKNSEFNQSHYAGYGWELNKYLGLSAGIITGYELNNVLPYIVPVIRYQNISLVVAPYPEAVIHLTIDIMEF